MASVTGDQTLASGNHASLHTQGAQKDEVNTFTKGQLVQNSDTAVKSLEVRSDTGHANGMRERFAIENNTGQVKVDLNLRDVVVNLGSTNPSVSQGVGLLFVRPTGDTVSCITVYAAGSGSTVLLNINSVGAIDQRLIGASTTYYTIQASGGETNPRFRIREGSVAASPRLEWGPGGATAVDTNLYRSAADTLKTDDKFIAGAGIGVGNSAAATTPGTVTKKMEVFDASGNSLGFVPIYDAIT